MAFFPMMDCFPWNCEPKYLRPSLSYHETVMDTHSFLLTDSTPRPDWQDGAEDPNSAFVMKAALSWWKIPEHHLSHLAYLPRQIPLGVAEYRLIYVLQKTTPLSLAVKSPQPVALRALPAKWLQTEVLEEKASPPIPPLHV